MRCIFCKSISDGCASVEHIVPESLGNIEHVLPRGWVCDTCNNYFAREVEKPFLDSAYGTHSRFEMSVANKRGRIPPVKAYHPQSRSSVQLFRLPQTNAVCFGPVKGFEFSLFITTINSEQKATLHIPRFEAPERSQVTSRFIGKIAVEVLAQTCLAVENANHEIVEQRELDELRHYVRFGIPKTTWPVHMRRIYRPDLHFVERKYGTYEVLHEWKIIQTSGLEYYVIIAIFGIEYAINLGGPYIDGFIRWLQVHNGKSPLY